MHPDLFRPDKQAEVIDDIKSSDVKLVITKKDEWDNLSYFTDEATNLFTFNIWRYVASNFKVEKEFIRFYVLTKKGR